MKLPSPGYAIVPRRKVRDYLLSANHPVGRHKAAFFRSLGYTQADWSSLAAELRHMAGRRVARATRNWYGVLYEIRGPLTGPSGHTARLVTVWIVRADERRARFVTAYPET